MRLHKKILPIVKIILGRIEEEMGRHPLFIKPYRIIFIFYFFLRGRGIPKSSAVRFSLRILIPMIREVKYSFYAYKIVREEGSPLKSNY